MINTEVIIVGAGPTGLALAVQLIRCGIDFVIIDQKETTTLYSRALGVQARTLEIYEQIGLADELVALGAKAEGVRLVVGGEVRGKVDLANLGEGLSKYPFLLLVEQGKHEKLLYDYIKLEGKEVLWETTLESFSQDEGGVTANIKTANGETETIAAKFLVGCDGPKSIVRHTLGLTFEGSTLERLFYVADVDINWEYPHDAMMVFLMKNNLLAFFPMVGENRWRIVGTFPEEFANDKDDILYSEIEEQIKKDTEIDNLDITKVNWFSTYKVHSRRVNKFSNGRCFLAGDSAHIHTPAGGQGMNTGIQDGYNLAWKLAAVLRGNAKLSLLETYDEERSANAKRLLQTTDRFFDFAAGDEWYISFLRMKVFPYIANFAFHFDSAKKFIFPLVSQIGINYRESSLSVTIGSFTVKAGDRLPLFEIEGASIYEKLKLPKFHLITFFDGKIKPIAVAENDSLDVLKFPLYPNITEIFGNNKTFSVLLRPDNYISLITDDLSLDNFFNFVEKFLHDAFR